MRKGFTLIELMVVVLIVAVLAAILIPMMTARLESARWAEGRAGAGSLATSIRAMYAEVGEEGWADIGDTTDPLTFMTQQDLKGKYFDYTCYVISNVALTPEGEYPLTYTIIVSPLADSDYNWEVTSYQLDEQGIWTKN